MRRVRRRVYEIIEVARPGDRASRIFDISLLSLIFLNVIAVILSTVGPLYQQRDGFFWNFEVFSVAVFTIEYVLRIWSCVEDPRYARPIRGRLRFALRPVSIIDLLAILPFYLPYVGVDLRFARVLRLLRVFRIVRVGEYYESLRLLGQVFRDKREELILSTSVMLMLLVIAASAVYYCEHSSQPEAFSSIPAAMWWAVATLTTVGYGDVAPVTAIGKLVASVIAILGIGMVALPTGIIGAGFVEVIQQRKTSARCPHCGEELGPG